MGRFLVRHVDHESGTELARFVLPNVLAYEGAERVYRAVFPPLAVPTLKLGLSGATLRAKEERPNPTTGELPFGPELTFTQLTAPDANEGGGYTDAMRASFGYERQTTLFDVALNADGGGFTSQELEFPNQHEWTPQDEDDWDDPNTEFDIEQAPPAWTSHKHWEPVVGYPWQRPRKLCSGYGDPVYVPAYMEQWDGSGALNWLCDFRKLGGFPLHVAFLHDTGSDTLISATRFRAPVLLRPGTALHVRYQARLWGSITREFALRWASSFAGGGMPAYDSIHCRPVLQTPALQFTPRTTYANVEPHFVPQFGAVSLGAWNFVGYSAGPPEVMPRVESATAPQWTNSSGGSLGPFAWIAVYGTIGATPELMWLAPISPPITIPDGDTLQITDKVQLELNARSYGRS